MPDSVSDVALQGVETAHAPRPDPGLPAAPRAALEAAGALRVQVADTVQMLDALALAWQDLVERCPTADLFALPHWHQAWWRAFGTGRQPALLSFWHGDDLVGVLPLCRHRDRLRGWPVRVLGSYNNAHASRTPVLVAPQCEGAVAAAFAAFLGRDAKNWDVVQLRQVAADGGWLSKFVAAAAAQPLTVFGPVVGMNLSILPLTPGWKAYLAGRGAHFRNRMKENRRRLERIGEVRYVPGSGGGGDFDLIEALEPRSWKGSDDQARLDRIGWQFQREVARGKGVRCHNLFLEVDGAIRGAVHTVGFRDVAYSLQTLFDEELRPRYPGRVQFGVHVQQLFEDGRYRALDLNGGSPYCRSWTDDLLEFSDLQIYSCRPYSACLAALKRIAGRQRWARSS